MPQHILIWLAECVVLGDDGRIGPMVLAHGQPGQVDRLLVGLQQFNVAASRPVVQVLHVTPGLILVRLGFDAVGDGATVGDAVDHPQHARRVSGSPGSDLGAVEHVGAPGDRRVAYLVLHDVEGDVGDAVAAFILRHRDPVLRQRILVQPVFQRRRGRDRTGVRG